jgi:hypothetical protein
MGVGVGSVRERKRESDDREGGESEGVVSHVHPCMPMPMVWGVGESSRQYFSIWLIMWSSGVFSVGHPARHPSPPSLPCVYIRPPAIFQRLLSCLQVYRDDNIYTSARHSWTTSPSQRQWCQ